MSPPCHTSYASTQTFSVGTLRVTVETRRDGTFRLRVGQTCSRFFDADAVGWVECDGTCFFYGPPETTSLSTGTPWLGIPTTVV